MASSFGKRFFFVEYAFRVSVNICNLINNTHIAFWILDFITL